MLELKNRADPSLVLTRVLNIIDRILRRSAYVALLNENPPALGKLVNLCERSAYLAEQVNRYPVLLDELLDPRVFSSSLEKSELQAELDRRIGGLG